MKASRALKTPAAAPAAVSLLAKLPLRAAQKVRKCGEWWWFGGVGYLDIIGLCLGLRFGLVGCFGGGERLVGGLATWSLIGILFFGGWALRGIDSCLPIQHRFEGFQHISKRKRSIPQKHSPNHAFCT